MLKQWVDRFHVELRLEEIHCPLIGWENSVIGIVHKLLLPKLEYNFNITLLFWTPRFTWQGSSKINTEWMKSVERAVTWRGLTATRTIVKNTIITGTDPTWIDGASVRVSVNSRTRLCTIWYIDARSIKACTLRHYVLDQSIITPVGVSKPCNIQASFPSLNLRALSFKVTSSPSIQTLKRKRHSCDLLPAFDLNTIDELVVPSRTHWYSP